LCPPHTASPRPYNLNRHPHHGGSDGTPLHHHPHHHQNNLLTNTTPSSPTNLLTIEIELNKAKTLDTTRTKLTEKRKKNHHRRRVNEREPPMEGST